MPDPSLRERRTEAAAVDRILEGIATQRSGTTPTGRASRIRVRSSPRGAPIAWVSPSSPSTCCEGPASRRERYREFSGREPGADGYDSHIGGVYHRWIEIYYPDLGFVFSDPSSSINGVDARYIPFGRRELERPRGLTLTAVETSGRVDYPIVAPPGGDAARAAERRICASERIRRPGRADARRPSGKIPPSHGGASTLGGGDRGEMAAPLGGAPRRPKWTRPSPGTSSTCSTCSRTRRAAGSTSGTGATTSWATRSIGASGWPGRRTLNPMGWDAFGLPAENAAIAERRASPRVHAGQHRPDEGATLTSLGCLYDWSKELASCDPGYYRWNQWLFLRMWERGLAYRKTAPVNWCPGCRTVLANEQVVDGRCERSDDLVEIRDLTQWFFRITDYAERLLAGLDGLDWPDRVKTMQRNWIGRSEGAEIFFRVEGLAEPVTRLHDAARHALRRDVSRARARAPGRGEARRHDRRAGGAIDAFVERVRRESRLEREAEGAEKEGLDTGIAALQPGDGREDPGLARQLRAARLRDRRASWACRRTTSATSSSPASSDFRFVPSTGRRSG